jgi:hypothetical protein
MEKTKSQLLDELHFVIEEIENARSMDNLTKPEKIFLETTSLKLSNIEQTIIQEISENLVSKLTIDAMELNEMSEQINKSSQSLEKVAKNISKVTELLNFLVKAISEGAKLI